MRSENQSLHRWDCGKHRILNRRDQSVHQPKRRHIGRGDHDQCSHGKPHLKYLSLKQSCLGFLFADQVFADHDGFKDKPATINLRRHAVHAASSAS